MLILQKKNKTNKAHLRILHVIEVDVHHCFISL